MAYVKQYWQLTYFDSYDSCLYHMHDKTNGATMLSDNNSFIQNGIIKYINKFNGTNCNIVSGWINVQNEIVRSVIGLNGCYLKKTTEKQNALFIWHCRDSGKILVWGDKFAVIKSLNQLYKRVLKCSFDYVTRCEMNEILNTINYNYENEKDEFEHPYSNLNSEIENQSIIDFNNDYVKSLRQLQFAC